MKKLLFSLIVIAITVIAQAQNTKKVMALIPGYKTSDTIKMSDFIKISELSLDNKEYSISSFVLLYSNDGYDYEQMSKSNQFTENMKSSISKLNEKNNKMRYIILKDIFVRKPNEKEIKIDDLIVKLKMD